MYLFFLTLITIVSTISGCTAAAGTNISSNPVQLVGMVDRSYISKADDLIERATKEDVIDIVINSPGGYVIFGNLYINAMELVKSRGVKLRCYVTHIAASMAFQILAHCSERYALANSYLLWHPVRISGELTLTPQVAAAMAKSLSLTEDQLLKDLRTYFRPEDDAFWFHYYQESLLPADTVAEMLPSYITILNDFSGIQNLEKGVFGNSSDSNSEEEEVDELINPDYDIRFIKYIMPSYSRGGK